jgi:hypothetical protein
MQYWQKNINTGILGKRIWIVLLTSLGSREYNHHYWRCNNQKKNYEDNPHCGNHTKESKIDLTKQDLEDHKNISLSKEELKIIYYEQWHPHWYRPKENEYQKSNLIFFTIGSQLVKPLCLYIIWLPVLPLQDQPYYSLYHRPVIISVLPHAPTETPPISIHSNRDLAAAQDAGDWLHSLPCL